MSAFSLSVARDRAEISSRTFTPVRVAPQLDVRGVSRSYPNREDPSRPLEILRDVDLKISAGEVVSLSGPSGCGKSTLLQIIAGNLAPSGGEVWWGDQRLDTLDDAARAQWRLAQLGLIFQDFRLFDHLSALENVALPLELLGSSARDAQREAHRVLEQLGLGARRAHLPSALSGGEQQRVAIARALVHRPTLLLADEPTGNLDRESAQRVEELLLSLPRLSQVGLLYITHDLRFAARADTHWGLHEGALLQRSAE